MSIANDVVDKYNAIVGGAAVILSAILGKNWVLFVLYFVFMLMDWITGTYRSKKLNIESSEAGYEGIKKKCMGIIILLVGFLAPIAFVHLGELVGVDLSFTALFGYLVLAMLMVNELRSITENLLESGCKVPGFMTKGLAVAERLISKKAESILPDERED